MPIEVIFFIEVLAGGLLAGVMYALVALGFVLIYKASGVFNFAQGSMVFFAALTFVSLTEKGWNFWLALAVTLAVMIVLGMLIERIVLRPLINQPPITLLMATIGLTFVLEGLSQLAFGSQPHGLEIGIPDVPIEWLSEKWNINISQFDLFAAFVAGVLVAVLALLFQKTRIGRALRAADARLLEQQRQHRHQHAGDERREQVELADVDVPFLGQPLDGHVRDADL